MSNCKKPNLLYIFSDQHRKFDLGCYGHPFVQTPNLDWLASKGLLFTHCVSNSPVCVPARGTLLTGQFAGKHKAFTNDIAIDPNCESIADVLKMQGYHTGYIGKWHLGGIPRDQAITKERRLGFEEWKVCNCNHNYLDTYYYDEEDQRVEVAGYEPEIFGELAIDFLENNREKADPWALYLSFATPHDPFTEIDDVYGKMYQDVTLRENIQEKVMWKWDHFYSIKEYTEMAKGYFGHITAIDHQVGLLLNKLRETGELENTIVIYSSDHGDMLGSHGHKDKQLPYEESIAIPLIAYYPERIYHGVCDELIGLNDLPVSLAGLLGASFTSETDGENLQDLFTNPEATSYESAYLVDYYPCHQAEKKKMKAWRGIRTKQYTYAVQADCLDWLLFDNKADPYQMNNLAGKAEYAALQQQLWQLLNEHIEQHDKLLNGLDYVAFAKQAKEFNESQRHFHLTSFAREE